MNDQKKTELWQQLVTKHTTEAKAKAEAAGNVAKETTPQSGAAGDTPPAGSEAPTTPPIGPDGDQLVALNKRLDNLEARLGEIGKSIETVIAKATEIADAAVAKAASEQATAQATAKAEADKLIADAKAIVDGAKATADRIEALAPRGAGKRIDEVGKGKDAPTPAEKTEEQLLAENAPGVLKMAEGAK